MAEKKYSPPKNLINPFIKNFDEYKSMYHQSIDDPQAFFGGQAEENVTWMEPFKSVHNNRFSESKWFEGGKINIAYNCIDRHLKEHADKTALIWEGDNSEESINVNFSELYKNVGKFSNVLKSLGAAKG